MSVTYDRRHMQPSYPKLSTKICSMIHTRMTQASAENKKKTSTVVSVGILGQRQI